MVTEAMAPAVHFVKKGRVADAVLLARMVDLPAQRSRRDRGDQAEDGDQDQQADLLFVLHGTPKKNARTMQRTGGQWYCSTMQQRGSYAVIEITFCEYLSFKRIEMVLWRAYY